MPCFFTADSFYESENLDQTLKLKNKLLKKKFLKTVELDTKSPKSNHRHVGKELGRSDSTKKL